MSDSHLSRPTPQISGLYQTLGIMWFIGFFGFLLLPLRSTDPYFFAPGTFLSIVIVFSVISGALAQFERFTAALTCGVITIVFFAYGCFEVVYAGLPSAKHWVDPASPAFSFWNELRSYAGNRALQLIPIALTGFLIARFLGRHWRHRVRTGTAGAETTILGGSQAQSWKKVAGRIAAYMSIAVIGFLVARGVNTGGSDRLVLYAARLIGGSVNSFVEELLFRGVLQPVFETLLSAGAANTLQALFFSVIHFGFIGRWTVAEVAPELVKLLLYTGIGLFLGRAARETNGLLVSWFFHALITAAIWTLLTVQGS